VRDLYRKALKALRNRVFLVSPPPETVKEMVREALHDHVPKGNLDNVVEEFLAEARERSKEALEGFLEDLGLSPLPVIEKSLRNGEDVGIAPWWDSEEVVVTFGCAPFSRESAPLPPRWKEKEWPEISVNTSCGGIVTRLEVEETEKIWIGSEQKERLVFRLDAGRGRAFFYALEPEAVARALEVVEAFGHLFCALELEDLLEALEELEHAKDGEARQLGEYVLVRGDGIQALVRGGIFGDLVLDEAFFLDRKVEFSSPSGDIAIVLRCRLGRGEVGVEGFVRYEDTRINFTSNDGVDILTEDLGDALLREGLNTVLAWCAPPPVLEAVLEAILDEEHPSRALKDEVFFRALPLVVFGKLS
jgi:hypothetical protein